MSEKITIGACWDGGDYYPPYYVNRLFNACLRNVSMLFDFVLYVGPMAEEPGRTDEIDPRIRIVPVGLPSWWSGMVFWKPDPPGIETDSILYLDLDQVIIGNLDAIINFPSNHACMKDFPSFACPPGKEKDGCVSTTLIRKGFGARVWEEYVRAGMPTWDVLKDRPGKLPMAAQGLVNQYTEHALFPEDWICSYKLWIRKHGIPENCKIVSFHGHPKPHEVRDRFVLENWR